MKKKFLLSLIILVLFTAAGVCYYLSGQTTFDSAFQRYDALSPAKAADTLTVAKEGSYPGMSDTPVTIEEGRSYRELMSALRGQKYLPLPALFGPPDGGLALYYISGCSPECIAYWDGTFLWLAGEASESWNRLLPLPPHVLGQKLDTICK